MEKITRLTALLLFLAASLSAYAGYTHSGSNGKLIDSAPDIPVITSAAKSLMVTSENIVLHNEWQQVTKYRQSGMLYPLGSVAVVLLLFAVYAFYISAKLTAEAKVRSEVRISWGGNESFEHDTKPIAASTRYRMEIDESLLEHAPTSEEEKIFSTLNSVIALSHSSLEDKQITTILNVLRPDILKMTNIITPGAQERIAKQILSHYILMQKRAEKGIAADQFRLQDQRTNELSRETIARRFMPKRPDHIPPELTQDIGLVYDLAEQAQVQQKSFTQIEDWQDLSLRNAVDVMKTPVITAPAGVAAATPAAASSSDLQG